MLTKEELFDMAKEYVGKKYPNYIAFTPIITKSTGYYSSGYHLHAIVIRPETDIEYNKRVKAAEKRKKKIAAEKKRRDTKSI